MRAGLADPTHDSQRVFLAVLEAMAHPGRVVDVGVALDSPPPLGPATAAVCLALLDLETPVWLDAGAATADIVEYLRFHAGAPVVDRTEAAAFAVLTDVGTLATLGTFPQGTGEFPESPAMLVVQVDALRSGAGIRLSGPRIAGGTALDVGGAGPTFLDVLRRERWRFPRGVDLLLTAGARLAAIPRTTRVAAPRAATVAT